MMPEECSHLQNLSLSLFEMWWHKNIAGREELVPQTLSLMIQKILSPKAPVNASDLCLVFLSLCN